MKGTVPKEVLRTIKFYTLGCKVNQYDTQSIREKFLRQGFQEIDNGQKADIYLINTCSVTSTADRKSRQIIHSAHRQNPKAQIVVTGCYTELDSDKISAIPGVTNIIKNNQKERMLELLNEDNGPDVRGGISNFYGRTRVFLKIQDGCDNFCSYCKVPLVRGRSRSRPIKEIIEEAGRLVKNGFKEIVLSGICLGAYGKDLTAQGNLVEVIEALEKIEGLLRIRLSSIEAMDISGGLIAKIKESKKLCPHLHIPLQSGDDDILKKMKRNYSRNEYLGLIKKIKKNVPGIAITTDCLAGFPGESEENFQNSLSLIKAILPLKVHIFPYSRREGTSAASNFKDGVGQQIIKERLLRLKEIAQECAFIYKKQFLNKDTPVLIEGRPDSDRNLWEGYTDNYLKVRLKGLENINLQNQLISVKIKKIEKDICQAKRLRK